MRVVFSAAAAVVMATGSGFAQTAQPSITFVHGIPGHDVASTLLPSLPVDLAIDGTCIKFAVDFGSVSGPFPLVSGTHSVAVSPANTLAPCGTAPILTANVSLPNNGQIALVAQESAGGPTLGQYGLAQGLAVPAGQTRYLVIHAANAPAVDVKLASSNQAAQRQFKNLQPGQSASNTTISFGGFQVYVYPAGTTTPVAGPVGVSGAGRSVVALFVVGSAANGTVTVIRKETPGVF